MSERNITLNKKNNKTKPYGCCFSMMENAVNRGTTVYNSKWRRAWVIK